jgi:hypothetical protein
MERRSESTGDVESVFVEADGTERKCAGTVLPDLMTFKDSAGETQRIFLEIGTHERAYQLVMDENWEELKKFPKHGTYFCSNDSYLIYLLIRSYSWTETRQGEPDQ